MYRWFALVLLAAFCWLMIPGTVLAAEPKIKEVTWESMPFAVPEGGEVRCPGHGDPLPGLFPPWCPPDSRTIVRDRVVQCQITASSDPRIAGVATETVNFNFDPNFAGPAWGTMRIDVPAGGSWEGYAIATFSGPGTATMRIVLFGSGPLEGMRLKARGTFANGKTTWAGRIKGKPRRSR